MTATTNATSATAAVLYVALEQLRLADAGVLPSGYSLLAAIRDLEAYIADAPKVSTSNVCPRCEELREECDDLANQVDEIGLQLRELTR